MQFNVPCKINLGLHILNRRPDGFHNLESVFYPVPIFDQLTVEKSNRFELFVSGMAIEGSPDDNLCVRAYRLLAHHFEVCPVSIHLNKQIPTGAGLGGGSADAAFTLKALNFICDLGLPSDKLKQLAATLGSDCPFFIDAVPALATGRGEVLTPLSVDLSGYWLVVAKPSVSVSTKEAYQRVRPVGGRPSPSEICLQSVDHWAANLVNDFEHHVIENYPVIGRIKNELIDKGAIFSQMSGSGSAVFALFGHKPELTLAEADFIRIVCL